MCALSFVGCFISVRLRVYVVAKVAGRIVIMQMLTLVDNAPEPVDSALVETDLQQTSVAMQSTGASVAMQSTGAGQNQLEKASAKRKEMLASVKTAQASQSQGHDIPTINGDKGWGDCTCTSSGTSAASSKRCTTCGAAAAPLHTEGGGAEHLERILEAARTAECDPKFFAHGAARLSALPVEAKDVRTLAENVYVHDRVMDCVCNLVQQRLSAGTGATDVIVMSAHFSQQLQRDTGGENRGMKEAAHMLSVAVAASGRSLSEYKRIVFPANPGRVHWVEINADINPKTSTARRLLKLSCSAGWTSTTCRLGELPGGLTNVMAEAAAMLREHSTPCIFAPTPWRYPAVPRQENADCGPSTLACIEASARGQALSHSASSLRWDLRAAIAEQIMAGSLFAWE